MFQQTQGSFLRVNTYYGRWEISTSLEPLIKVAPDSFDPPSFYAVSCYTLCPAHPLEAFNEEGEEEKWLTKCWSGAILSLECEQHTFHL